MQDARDIVHRRVSEVRAFLAQEQPPRLSESDTKANFIEPIIAALGWHGINVVTREYYVRNSQEFIDYVMRGPDGLLLAIEAKPIQTELTDKHAAQLIQYCAVEGIEWAALTNGRELQFFNTFLKPDLAAKRVLRLDLLAFNTDSEFDVLFGQIWQLSRESMTQPKGVRTWLHQKRLDDALRRILLDPATPISKQLRKLLAANDINATAHELVQWFRAHLGAPASPAPFHRTPGPVPREVDVSSTGLSIPVEPAITPLITSMPDETPPTDGISYSDHRSRPSRTAGGNTAGRGRRTTSYYGITLNDLYEANLLSAGTRLILTGNGSSAVTEAVLNDAAEIVWQGQTFRSLSDKTFAALLGRTSINGWTHWLAELSHGRESLFSIRERYRARNADFNAATEAG